MKNGKLAGKVAVVTGASKGIGASSCQAPCRRGSGGGRQLQLEQGGGRPRRRRDRKRTAATRSRSRRTSPSRPRSSALCRAKKAFGRLDILVNNAGVYDWSPLEEITEEHFHKLFDVNVLGLLLATQEAVKHFGPTGGNIINISSTVTSLRRPMLGLQRDKGAVDAVTERWPRSSVRARSASTRSIPAWWKRKACTQRDSPRAIFAKALKHKRRSAALASPRTLRPPRSSSLPPIPRGSPAKRYMSRVAFVKPRRQ